MAYTFSLPILSVLIEPSHDGTELQVTETTGAYDLVTNPYGWGAPGALLIGDVDSSNIKIQNLSSTDATVYTIDSTGDFPNDTLDSIVITNDQIGGIAGDRIPDGVYSLEYTVVVDSDRNCLAPLRKHFLVCYEAEKCISNLVANLKVKDCCCNCDEVNQVLTAFMYFKALKYAGCTGSVSRANELLKALSTMCANINCEDC